MKIVVFALTIETTLLIQKIILFGYAIESPIQCKANLPKQNEDDEISKRVAIINFGITTAGKSLVFTV